MTTQQNKDPIRSLAKRVILIAVAAGAVMAVMAVVFGTASNAYSVVVGSLVGIASFLVLVWAVLKTLGPSKWSKAAIAVIGFLKLGVLGVVLWWLISSKMVEPITFLAGFSSVIVALLIESIRLRRTTDRV